MLPPSCVVAEVVVRIKEGEQAGVIRVLGCRCLSFLDSEFSVSTTSALAWQKSECY